MSPKLWPGFKVLAQITDNILYLPIAHQEVKSIPIQECNEELVDLLTLNNPRLKPFSLFDKRFQEGYEGYSKVRKGVAERLIKMLDLLPLSIGVTFSEGFRPLYKQKEYFDKKLQENIQIFQDKEKAYQETCKSISPFIDNIPPHCTGAAIDISLFQLRNGQEELIEMGQYDTIFGENHHQETFSLNTTEKLRLNRLLLLNAALQAGFVNYGYEWWHYSYGDKMWAYVKKKKYAIYGLLISKNEPIFCIKKAEYLKGF